VKRELLSGNEACAEGALRAGVKFFGGYPITPSTEIAEYMAKELPKRGGIFLQFEDEIASIVAIIGASAAGMKSMTATSGPGFSLMQEGIGYASMIEVPVVIVNVMRGGPATGLPTKGSQADFMQARWGTHGDHPVFVNAPSTVYEAFEFTIKAIEVAERLRIPAVVLLDEFIGHMREIVELPEKVEVYSRKKPRISPEEYLHYDDNNSYNAPYASIGDGFRIHFTGLHHRKDGFPTTDDPEWIKWKNERLRRKIEDNRAYLEDIEILGEGEIGVVSFGSAARACLEAKSMAEKKGKKIQVIRLKTLWPFPELTLARILKDKKEIAVVEMNEGQLVEEIKKTVDKNKKIISIVRNDGEFITPQEIAEQL